jgi:hypothetical protein
MFNEDYSHQNPDAFVSIIQDETITKIIFHVITDDRRGLDS